MHRYAVSLVLFLVILWSGVNTFAQESLPRPEVERLVRAFGAVEMFQARAAGYLKVVKKPDEANARQTYILMERIAAAKREDLSPAFVEAFSGSVTKEEAVQMAEALESPMGRKIISLSIDVFRIYNGDVIAARDANPLSPEERKQFEALGATPGWKIYERISKDPSFGKRAIPVLLSMPMFSDLQ